MKSYFMLLVCCLLLLGCKQGQQPPKSKQLTGQQLFEVHCESCHGHKGTGNFRKGIPANIVTQKSRQELVTWLKNLEGIPRAAPSFPYMNNKDAFLIVDHLISLKSKHINTLKQRIKND